MVINDVSANYFGQPHYYYKNSLAACALMIYLSLVVRDLVELLLLCQFGCSYTKFRQAASLDSNA